MVSNPMRDPAVTVGIGGDASGLNSAVGSAQNSLAGLRKSVGLVSGALAGLGGAAIAGSISAFGDFDEAMQESVAVMGDVSDGMRADLEQTAREVATSTRHSHEEAAESFYYLSSAGLEAQESIAAMPEVADFAAAGNMEMAEATDVATNVMSAFGYEADQMNQVTDTLAGTVANHNQTMEGMSTAMSQVAPISSSLGISIEETSAAIGMLGDVGIQGSRAGTQLRNVFSKLSDESSTASQELAAMGVTLRDNEGNLLSFEEILRNMNDAGVDASDAAKIFGRRAGPAMAALLEQGSDQMGENTEHIADMEGATQDMAETQRDTLNAAIDIFRSRLNDIAITIGEAFMPMVNDMMSVVNDAADRFGEFIDTVDSQTLAKVLGGGTFAAIATAISALVSGPIGLLIGAIGILTAAWTQNWGNIQETAQTAIGVLTDLWDEHGDEILGFVDTVVATLQDLGEIFFEVIGTVVDFLDEHQEEISDIIGGVIEVLTDLAEVVDTVLSDVQEWFEDNEEAIESAIDGVMDVLSGYVDFYVHTLFPAVRRVLEWLAPRIDRVVGAIASNLGPVLAEVGETLSALADYAAIAGDVLTSMWKSVDQIVVPIVSGLTDILETGLISAIDLLGEGLQLVMNILQGDFGEALENLKSILSTAIEGSLDILGVIKDGIAAAVAWIGRKGANVLIGAFEFITGSGENKGLPGVITDGFKSGFEDAAEWLKKGPSTIAEAIESLADAIKDAVQGAITDAVTLGLASAGADGEIPSGSVGVTGGGVSQYRPSAQTGGRITSSGMVKAHAGEVIVPPAQVSDRGPADIAVTMPEGTTADMSTVEARLERINDQLRRLEIPSEIVANGKPLAEVTREFDQRYNKSRVVSR